MVVLVLDFSVFVGVWGGASVCMFLCVQYFGPCAGSPEGGWWHHCFPLEGSNNSTAIACMISTCTVMKFVQLCEITEFLSIVHFNQVSRLGHTDIPLNCFKNTLLRRLLHFSEKD